MRWGLHVCCQQHRMHHLACGVVWCSEGAVRVCGRGWCGVRFGRFGGKHAILRHLVHVPQLQSFGQHVPLCLLYNTLGIFRLCGPLGVEHQMDVFELSGGRMPVRIPCT